MDRTFILADGENLVARYEASLSKGAEAVGSTYYIPGLLVWHPNITGWKAMGTVVRVSYYTTHVGDEKSLEDARAKIAQYEYTFHTSEHRNEQGRICPHVFKKERNSAKTKSVDINLTIDALRHTYNNSLDTLFLLSGDGDYIPLIQEVMRQGKRVIVGAFSQGLNPELRHLADHFLNLDQWTLKWK